MITSSQQDLSLVSYSLFSTRTAPFSIRERILIGVLCGTFIGVLYAFVSGAIDVWLIRDLPLRIDWEKVGSEMVLTGIGCAALGGITFASSNSLKGILSGTIALVGFYAVRSFFQPHVNSITLSLIMLYIILPIAVLMLPVVGGLRFALNHYEGMLSKQGTSLRIAQGRWLLIVAVCAMFAGSWAQMPPEARVAVHRVNELLKVALSSTATDPLPLAVRDIKNFRERATKAYQLDQQKSLAVASGTDVHVYFGTGLALTCIVDDVSHSVFCVEGKQSPFGQFNPRDQR